MKDVPTGQYKAERWYIGAMNDALFIINRPPSPSGTDVPPGIYPGDPTVILATWPLPIEKVQAIVDEHNASLHTNPTVASQAASG